MAVCTTRYPFSEGGNDYVGAPLGLVLAVTRESDHCACVEIFELTQTDFRVQSSDDIALCFSSKWHILCRVNMSFSLQEPPPYHSEHSGSHAYSDKHVYVHHLKTGLSSIMCERLFVNVHRYKLTN